MLWELIAFAFVALIIILLFIFVRSIVLLVVNSVIGFFALVGFNYVFNANVQINFWSILITVVGGIIGFLVVIISHYLGWAF